MVKLNSYLTVLASFAVTVSIAASEAPNCETLQCDCQSLSTSALARVCTEREAQLRHQCAHQGLAQAGYCGFYGEEANRGTMSLFDALTQHALAPDAALLHVKWGALRRSLMGNLKRLDDGKNQLPLLAVKEDLRQLQTTVDELLKIQTQLAKLENGQPARALAAQTWVQFSEVVTDTAGVLAISREDLTHPKEAAAIAAEITNVEAALYEQAGYGFDKSGEHARAAAVWKKSADIALELMTQATAMGETDVADGYRYQRSTRLHRARESLNKTHP